MMNNSTIILILNGITQRISTILATCEDEDASQSLTLLSENIDLVVSETLKGQL